MLSADLAPLFSQVPLDVNPGNRRIHGRYANYCRISFGPEMRRLETGLDGLERVIGKFKAP